MRISALRETVMRWRAITATTAALSILFVVAAPALADTDHVLFQPQMDWRLAIVFAVVGLVVFGLALRGMRRRS
jgi:hypothetical protein